MLTLRLLGHEFNCAQIGCIAELRLRVTVSLETQFFCTDARISLLSNSRSDEDGFLATYARHLPDESAETSGSKRQGSKWIKPIRMPRGSI